MIETLAAFGRNEDDGNNRYQRIDLGGRIAVNPIALGITNENRVEILHRRWS